jgi:hypothetical protein
MTTTAPAKIPPVQALAKRTTVPMAARLVFALCGLGLLVGFFMPWLTLGDLVSVSGLGLAFSEGQMVSMISGSHRFLLFAIPALAVLLVIGGVVGNRLAPWAAVAGGIVVLGYGLFTVIRLFISSTGLGMWLVIGSAVVALALGLWMSGATRARKDRAATQPAPRAAARVDVSGIDPP